MLTENQYKAIELIALGESTGEEIGKACGCSSRNIYKWKLNSEFKAALHERSLEIKLALEQEGKCRMMAKGQMAIDNIIALANNSSSEKIKLDASIFIYEATFGKNINRNIDITISEDKDKVDTEQLTNEFNQFKVVGE